MANLTVEEFFSQDLDTVCEFLSRDDTRVFTEAEVLQVALGWLSHGSDRRFRDIQKILQCVRFQDTQKELVESSDRVKSVNNVVMYAAYCCSIDIPTKMAGQLNNDINVSSTGSKACTRGQSDLQLLLNNLSGRDQPCKEGKETEHVLKEKVKSKVKMNLKESIQSLQEKSEGEAVAEYKQLDVRDYDRLMFAACKNQDKNRYKNILPYDCTRVKLQDRSDDYINASHIKMGIKGKSKNYIATQAPKKKTCEDFWLMVWQQKAPRIVMLTTLTEGKLIMCPKYWPDNGQTINYGDIRVTCTKEEKLVGSFEREFKLVNLKTNEERLITHNQFVKWPESGVPEDSSVLFDFLQMIRRESRGIKEPIIVHCSAGVGRTGVFIALDTALSAMESKRPVYPLEIVKKLRDQRTMCVHKPELYLFLCKSIIGAYNKMVATADESQEKSPWRRMIDCVSKTFGHCCGVKEEINCLSWKTFGHCCGVKEKSTGKSFWKRCFPYLRRRCCNKVGVSENVVR